MAPPTPILGTRYRRVNKLNPPPLKKMSVQDPVNRRLDGASYSLDTSEHGKKS